MVLVGVSGSVLQTPLRSALLTVLFIGSAELKVTKDINITIVRAWVKLLSVYKHSIIHLSSIYVYIKNVFFFFTHSFISHKLFVNMIVHVLDLQRTICMVHMNFFLEKWFLVGFGEGNNYNQEPNRQSKKSYDNGCFSLSAKPRSCDNE